MPVSRKEFLDIQATIGCIFTLKRVLDMIRTYSQLKKKQFTDLFSLAWSESQLKKISLME